MIPGQRLGAKAAALCVVADVWRGEELDRTVLLVALADAVVAGASWDDISDALGVDARTVMDLLNARVR